MTFLATKVQKFAHGTCRLWQNRVCLKTFGHSKLELSDRANFISLMKISSGTPMEPENS